MLSRAGSPDVCRCESFICDHVCFVPVKCVSLVCFNRYQFQSLYDPLETFGENTYYTKRRCSYTIAH